MRASPPFSTKRNFKENRESGDTKYNLANRLPKDNQDKDRFTELRDGRDKIRAPPVIETNAESVEVDMVTLGKDEIDIGKRGGEALEKMVNNTGQSINDVEMG
ncbi:hypothetical protein Q3G72_023815 [Acer saccharum]|nr:hypothetical protein Q3G72_023815 [Acer saccharum]